RVVEVGDGAGRAGELQQLLQPVLAAHPPDQPEQHARLRAGEMPAAVSGAPLFGCLHTPDLSAGAPADSRGGSVHVDRDVLGLEVLLDALETALASDARPFPATERGSRVGDHALVEADHA